MTVVAVIPARSGSKGFPHKNIARIHGRSLLELAIAVGRDTPAIDAVYVSTDSPAYAEQAHEAGGRVLSLRPPYLSGDEVPTSAVVVQLLEELGLRDGVLVLLQPTSPVRTPADVEVALRMLEQPDVDAVASIERLDEPHPEKVKRLTQDGLLVPYIPGASSETPRQQLPPAYRLNGAIYAIKVPAFLRYRSFLPPRTHGFSVRAGINVDREEDFLLLQVLVDAGRVRLHGV